MLTETKLWRWMQAQARTSGAMQAALVDLDDRLERQAGPFRVSMLEALIRHCGWIWNRGPRVWHVGGLVTDTSGLHDEIRIGEAAVAFQPLCRSNHWGIVVRPASFASWAGRRRAVEAHVENLSLEPKTARGRHVLCERCCTRLQTLWTPRRLSSPMIRYLQEGVGPWPPR